MTGDNPTEPPAEHGPAPTVLALPEVCRRCGSGPCVRPVTAQFHRALLAANMTRPDLADLLQLPLDTLAARCCLLIDAITRTCTLSAISRLAALTGRTPSYIAIALLDEQQPAAPPDTTAAVTAALFTHRDGLHPEHLANYLGLPLTEIATALVHLTRHPPPGLAIHTTADGLTRLDADTAHAPHTTPPVPDIPLSHSDATTLWHVLNRHSNADPAHDALPPDAATQASIDTLRAAGLLTNDPIPTPHPDLRYSLLWWN